MPTRERTQTRRDFMATAGCGGIAASLLGGGVLGPWGAVNVEAQSLPGPPRIHGNPVATRDKDMKVFKDQAKVDLQIQRCPTVSTSTSRRGPR